MEAGKIYWINDDFKHIGPLESEFEHSVARISHSLVDDNLVKIISEPTDFGNGEVSLTIQLIRGKGFSYSGDFRDLESGEFSGKAEAELFLNKESYTLVGSWFEFDDEGEVHKYTWIAKINDRNPWQHFSKK